MSDNAAVTDVKDSEGWRIIAGEGTTGSYVRVERIGMMPWRGWVTEIDLTAGAVRIRDKDGRHRAARISECHVTRPTRAAKARSTMAKAASIKPSGNPRRRRGI